MGGIGVGASFVVILPWFFEVEFWVGGLSEAGIALGGGNLTPRGSGAIKNSGVRI